MQNQVTHYARLHFFKTYKAISVFALLLSALMLVISMLAGISHADACIDVSILIILAFFISRGSINAIVMAMVFWTMARTWNFYQAITQPEPSIALALMIFGWWSVCMHALYMTYCVERLHRTNQQANTNMILEEYFFYRLIKVLFFISLIFSLMFSIGLGSAFSPVQYVDPAKSFIACDNGAYYLLGPTHIDLADDQKRLDAFNDNIARKMCEYGTANDSANYHYEAPEHKNYLLSIAYQQEGSWLQAILAASSVMIILFFILHVIKEALLYLALGKKFAWRWVKNPLKV